MVTHKQFSDVLPPLYFTSASLSFIGSLSILIAVIVKKGANNFKVFPVFNIAAADFFASASLIASTTIYTLKVKTNNATEVDKHWYSDCRAIGAVVLCFYGVTFLLTASYPISLYINSRRLLAGNRGSEKQLLIKVMEKISTPVKSVYIFSWIFPVATAITMGIVYAKTLANNDTINTASPYCHDECLQLFNNDVQTCHNRTTDEKTWFYAYKGVFQGSLLIVILLDMLFYYLFLRNCRLRNEGYGIEGERQRETLRDAKWKAFRYQIVFIVCWLPCLVLSVVTTVDMIENSEPPNIAVWEFAFFVAQAALSPLQGFLNSIVYGWNRRIFWNIMCRNLN
ncbi:transmembrane protein 116-like [Oscarella lobularis]|uniref:transmembrane protein 116-like n=1 Tax=Oscarella lobularis TaxID=121494 RepID=UPI003313A981